MTRKTCWLLPCLSLMLIFPSLPRAGSWGCVPESPFFGVALDGYPITKDRLEKIEEEIEKNRREMKKAAERMDYEAAAKFRDQMRRWENMVLFDKQG